MLAKQRRASKCITVNVEDLTLERNIYGGIKEIMLRKNPCFADLQTAEKYFTDRIFCKNMRNDSRQAFLMTELTWLTIM